ncbi:helix-turn-helix transcriptional regulator [Caulobacter sp. SLTY]|uniref:helix-turn-helix domain-containing protein n=1 Tax=Caulobacter sp. SLTY TaxID=2683262 RepID=UPI001F10FF2D|nr:helix-turn-helix transcriptional regulator [Caulobacter sp. SLTY]
MPRSQHSAPDPIDVAVGARMRMRRKTLGLTQTALAEALGITFQQVQKYERGANRVSASMLVRAAKRLDCPVAFLVGEEPGGFPTDETLLTMLAFPGAIDLLHAYTAIDDATSRGAVVTVARALATGKVRKAAQAA